MGFRLHHPNIAPGVSVPGSVLVGPVRGSSTRAHMKLCITTNFKCGFSNSLILSITFSIMKAMMDLSLGWTSFHQDSWIKDASLHPLLLSQCIEGGIIAKLGLHSVREAVREQDSKWIQT